MVVRQRAAARKVAPENRTFVGEKFVSFQREIRNIASKTWARKIALGMLSSSSLLFATTVAAQTVLTTAGNSEVPKIADGSVDQLPEILVTARRRSETLQKVPVAVSVISGDTLRVQNLNNIPELISIIPAITLSPSGTKDTSLLIRGLGTITTSPGAEPTVAVVLDGVVLARPGQMVSDLIDLDRVEVLRGPQGTLFGKNASAGVINLTTASPKPEWSGFVEGSYFTGDEYRLTGVANGELAAGLLSGRIAVLHSRYNGNVTNILTNSRVGGRDSDGFRAKLLFTPAPDLKITLGTDYLNSVSTGNGAYVSTINVAYPSGVTTDSATLRSNLAAEGIYPSLRNRQISTDFNTEFRDKFFGAVAQVDYKIGNFDLTSITGYRSWRSTQHVDIDGFGQQTPSKPNEIEDHGRVHSTQVTQEVRLASPKGFIDYVIGLYYFHSINRETYRRDVNQLVGGNNIKNFGFNEYGTVSNNYSAFGEANINITSRFRGIAGARLVRDELRFDANRTSTSMVAVPGVNPAFAGMGSVGVTNYAARAGVQFDISDDIHSYFTYSRGYKGPAFNVFFNILARDTLALYPETSNDFELGVKSSLFDHHLLLNIALFDDKVANYQANQPDIVAGTVVTRLINAGDVSTKGVEIEAVARLTRDFSISGDYAYVDAKIAKFKCPVGAAVSCNVDGKPLPFAPKQKFSIRANYSEEITPRFKLDLNGVYTHQSEQQNSISQTPATIAPAYGLLSASIALTDIVNKIQARLLVRNALNKFYRSTYAQVNGGIVAGLPRDFERYYGFTLRKDF